MERDWILNSSEDKALQRQSLCHFGRHFGHTHDDRPDEHRISAFRCSFWVVSAKMHIKHRMQTRNEHVNRPHQRCQGRDAGSEPRSPDRGTRSRRMYHDPDRTRNHPQKDCRVQLSLQTSILSASAVKFFASCREAGNSTTLGLARDTVQAINFPEYSDVATVRLPRSPDHVSLISTCFAESRNPIASNTASVVRRVGLPSVLKER